jgi:hypothetical protein
MKFLEKKEKENPSIFLATTYILQLIIKIWRSGIIFSLKSGEID